MKNLQITRYLDKLHRITIPKSFCDQLRLGSGDALSLRITENGILIQKNRPQCVFCFESESLLVFNSAYVCRSCLGKLLQTSRFDQADNPNSSR